jgi:hypothetical protein
MDDILGRVVEVSMTTHQRHRRGPECLGESRAELGVAHQNVGHRPAGIADLKHWHPGAEKSTEMKYRP